MLAQIKVLLRQLNARAPRGRSAITNIEYILVAVALVFAFVAFVAILDPSLKRTFAGEWLGL